MGTYSVPKASYDLFLVNLSQALVNLIQACLL